MKKISYDFLSKLIVNASIIVGCLAIVSKLVVIIMKLYYNI